MKKLNNLLLKNFNAVLADTPMLNHNSKPLLKYGVVLYPSATKHCEDVLNYFENYISPEQLNSTFYKSWSKLESLTVQQRVLDQILHYLTTYGTDFTSEYIYIPEGHLDIPIRKKIPLLVIRGLNKEEIVEKCLNLLYIGIALDEQTIDDILEILHIFNYQFTEVNKIKNKEALVKICDKYNVYPNSPTEFLRFLVFKASGKTLLIKNEDLLKEIKCSKINISQYIENYGYLKCSEIFNRFKKIWLAFKVANKANVNHINKISRLSKNNHKPLPEDILNHLTSKEFTLNKVGYALNKVNNFRKIRVLQALLNRITNPSDLYLYKIRNGKSFVKNKALSLSINYLNNLYGFVYNHLLTTLDLRDLRVKYPKNIDYGVPSSEKMMIGNIPVGTSIIGEKLVVGIYWENKWGANDLDLSALSESGKVGWNSKYNTESLLYSGDMTDAQNGATELIYTKSSNLDPHLILNSIYTGDVKCKFRIIIGEADSIEKNYMFNPNELVLSVDTEMKSTQQLLGILKTDGYDLLKFTFLNMGFGNISVSSNSEHSINARIALQNYESLSLESLLHHSGAVFVDKDEDLDLTPNALEKDTIINLFS